MYNIDPGAVATLLQGGALPVQQGTAAAVPPQITQELNQIKEYINYQRTTEQATREATAQAQIDAFKDEKDEKGDEK